MKIYKLIKASANEDQENYFSAEELSYIDSKLHYIVFEWGKHLINHILDQARRRGIKQVYMNSSETLDAGANDSKTAYIYERLPTQLGGKRVNVDLRNRGNEPMWLLMNSAVEATNLLRHIVAQNNHVSIDQIPQKYQGAFIHIIGKKQFYTKEEISIVLNKLEQSAQKSKDKASKGFFYDWESSWSGAQRFVNNIHEVVVKQKLPSDVQQYIESDEILMKFWAKALTTAKHFDSDVVAFALVSYINEHVWVINEVQTDVINDYLGIRKKVQRGVDVDESQSESWETIKDMLEAANKSNWIFRLEGNEQLKQQIMDNPTMIGQLCDNSVDIDQWIRENNVAVPGLQL